jgi:hypothetical protein
MFLMTASKQSQDGTQFHPDSAWKKHYCTKLNQSEQNQTKQTKTTTTYHTKYNEAGHKFIAVISFTTNPHSEV